MIQIVMKPVKAPVVDHEGLYGAWFDGNLVLRVRARNARHAEEKFMYLMNREAWGKTLDFNLEQQKEKDNVDRNRMRADDEAGSAGNRPSDP